MDRERLTRLLDEPAKVGRDDLSDLRALAERFPWFSGAQLLLAAGEHAAGDMLFDERLRTTAAHLPSRAQLFELVHAAPAPRLTVVRDEPLRLPAERTTIVPPPRPDAPPPPSAPPLKEGPAAPIAEERPLPPEVPADVPAAPVAEEPAPSVPAAVTTPAEVEAPASAEVPAEPTSDLLDRQMRQAARSGSYDLLRDPAPAPVAPRSAADAPLDSAAASVPPPPAPAAKPAKPMATRLRFTEWLSHEGAEAPPSLPPPSVPAPPAVSDWLRAPDPEPAPPATTATLPSAKDLIDRFIQGTVPPAPKKAEFFTPQQAAKRSVEDDGLVSETLARIHAKQGNIAKAIEAYQRLALKHPEKSTYFAALSKALEGGPNK